MEARDRNKKDRHKVYLSLGANQDYPILQCYQAIYQLQALPGLEVVKRSSFYETEPYGYEAQSWFINLVLEIKTLLTPRELLLQTQGIEKKLGKNTKFKWGPRTIDIDILFYDQDVILEDDLKIPHPLLHLRNFVLQPLSEIAQDLHHPQSGKTVQELLLNCQDKKEVRKIEYVHG